MTTTTDVDPNDVDSAAELARAIAAGELIAVFQPQVDLQTGRIAAVEALSRWDHPVLGHIGPDDYIPLAERTGAIHAIGALMLDTGCGYAEELASLGRDVDVAVNVSVAQLSSAAFYDHLETNVVVFQLRPDAVTLEITESLAILDLGAVSAHLARARRRGYGISIDDFGVGFSTMRQLDRLPVTELKIDQSLLRDDSVNGRAQMTALVAVGLERDLRVVAEGVETQHDVDRVRDLGCHRAQGFFFAKALARPAMDELLAAA